MSCISAALSMLRILLIFRWQRGTDIVDPLQPLIIVLFVEGHESVFLNCPLFRRSIFIGLELIYLPITLNIMLIHLTNNYCQWIMVTSQTLLQHQPKIHYSHSIIECIRAMSITHHQSSPRMSPMTESSFAADSNGARSSMESNPPILHSTPLVVEVCSKLFKLIN